MNQEPKVEKIYPEFKKEPICLQLPLKATWDTKPEEDRKYIKVDCNVISDTEKTCCFENTSGKFIEVIVYHGW